MKKNYSFAGAAAAMLAAVVVCGSVARGAETDGFGEHAPAPMSLHDMWLMGPRCGLEAKCWGTPEFKEQMRVYYEKIARDTLANPHTESGDVKSAGLPGGILLKRIEREGENGVRVYLDAPKEFLASKGFNLRFCQEIAGALEQPLYDQGLSQFSLFLTDPATGEDRPMLDFFKEAQAGPEPDNALTDGTPAAKAGAGGAEKYGVVVANGQVTGALSGKAVVLNGSHGRLDDDSPAGWRVQRGKLFEVNEDMSSAEFMNHFVVPALLNAGARVQPVRECDVQTNMVIVDNADAGYVESPTSAFATSTANGFKNKTTASWSGLAANPFGFASATRYTAPAPLNAPTATATFTPTVPADGYYNVYISYSKGTNRTTGAHWQVVHSGGTSNFRINETIDGATWRLLGNFYFTAGTQGKVILLNDASDGTVVSCDAIRLGGGMGDMARRTHGVSGRPRWEEEANYYLQYNGMLASTLMSGDSTSTYDDEQLGWGNRPQYANWEQARDSEGNNTIYVGWHTNAVNGTCVSSADSSGTARGMTTYRDVDADATAGTESLTTLCHDAVINNIKKFADSTFSDRGIVASNGYGECSQGNLGSVAGFFFEGLFHDNSTDANLYKDPKFRYAAARGIQQGVIAYYGGSVFPPETPVNIRVRNAGSGNAAVDWTAGPVRTTALPYGSAATGFRIQRSTNGYGFDDGVDVGNVSTYTTAVTPGQATFFRVVAVNASGVSFPSETLAVSVPATGGARVLVVNGYHRYDRFLGPIVSMPSLGGCSLSSPNTMRKIDPRVFQAFNYTVQHGKAIAAAGYAFDSCADTAVDAGNISLSAYAAVDWIGGQEAEADAGDVDDNTAIKAPLITKLQNYLAGGGSLFITSSEMAWDFDRASGPLQTKRDFMHNYLKATYAADSSNTYTAVGSAGILSGVASFLYNDGTDPLSYAVRFPDVLTASGGSTSILTYSGGTGGTAGIQYQGAVGGSGTAAKIVYFGFGFEAIRSESVRNDVMSRVLTFLAPAGPPVGDPTLWMVQ
ncbi:hypothetical protein BH09SUM1_BH09SUM1_33870 [soil metagenome]